MSAKYSHPLNRPSAPPVGERSTNYIQKRLLEIERKPDLSADIKRRSKHEMEGIRLLCQHYKISWELEDEQKFTRLVFCLAEAHVPYFWEREPRKDTRWTLQRKEQLINDVSRARRETSGTLPLRCHRLGSVSYACSWLFLNDRRYAQDDPTSLEARYKAASSTPSLKGWESRAKRQETGDDVSDSRKAAPVGANKKIKNIRSTR